MIEDELRRALTGSLGQQQAGEIAREVAPILERHPLLGVLGPSQVVSAALPTITFLAQSSPNASAKEIAQDWQKAQAGSVGQSKEEPKKRQERRDGTSGKGNDGPNQRAVPPEVMLKPPASPASALRVHLAPDQ